MLPRFWKNSTCDFTSLRQPLPFLLRLGKHIFVPLLFKRESSHSSAQIALLLPVMAVQCPATQINGLLSREHERGGPTVDRRQETCFLPDKQWTSFWFLTEHLSSTQQREIQHVRFSVRTDSLHSVTTSYSAVKIKAPKLKDHLLNRRNNGALTLLAILWSCNATVLC